MFISKMNRLFHRHGRIAFAILTLLIIVPFVLYFSAAPQELLTMLFMRGEKSGIIINGKNVPQKSVDDAVTNSMLISALQGWPINLDSAETRKQFVSVAINSMILVNEAKKIGLRVNDKQIAQQIATMPVFQTDDRFDMNKYAMFVDLLGRYRLGEKNIEEAVGETLLVDLLKQQVLSSVIVTENEAHNFYNLENLTYFIKFAVFPTKDFKSKLTVDEKSVEAYHQLNRAKYTNPLRSKASVVCFKFADYEEQARQLISDRIVKGYYELNKKVFEKLKLEEAMNKIRTQLIKSEAKKIAKLEAQKFAVNVYKQIEAANTDKAQKKVSVIFSDLAARNSHKVIVTDKWIVNKPGETVENVGDESALVTAIGALLPDQPVSNAVEGKKEYFVACLVDRESPTLAKFENVKTDVVRDYKEELAKKFAERAANSAARSINKSVAEGKRIADILTTNKFLQDVKISKSDYKNMASKPYISTVAELALKTKEGGFSSVGNAGDAYVIVYVDKIELPSNEEYLKGKETAFSGCKMFKQQAAWVNFATGLRNNANVVIAQ